MSFPCFCLSSCLLFPDLRSDVRSNVSHPAAGSSSSSLLRSSRQTKREGGGGDLPGDRQTKSTSSDLPSDPSSGEFLSPPAASPLPDGRGEKKEEKVLGETSIGGVDKNGSERRTSSPSEKKIEGAAGSSSSRSSERKRKKGRERGKGREERDEVEQEDEEDHQNQRAGRQAAYYDRGGMDDGVPIVTYITLKGFESLLSPSTVSLSENFKRNTEHTTHGKSLRTPLSLSSSVFETLTPRFLLSFSQSFHLSIYLGPVYLSPLNLPIVSSIWLQAIYQSIQIHSIYLSIFEVYL